LGIFIIPLFLKNKNLWKRTIWLRRIHREIAKRKVLAINFRFHFFHMSCSDSFSQDIMYSEELGKVGIFPT